MKVKLTTRLVLAGLVLALVTLAMTGCPGGGTTPTVSVTGVEILHDNEPVTAPIPMTMGGPAVTLTAVILPANATNQNVSWAVTAGQAVAIEESDTGNRTLTVTAADAGSATVTVTTIDGQQTASVTFNVSAATQEPIAVTGVEIHRNGVPVTEAISVAEGGSVTLTAAVQPANAANQNVTWSTDNNAVATVAGGVVTAVIPGNATITVTTVDGEFTASVTVTVTEFTWPSLQTMTWNFDAEEPIPGWTPTPGANPNTAAMLQHLNRTDVNLRGLILHASHVASPVGDPPVEQGMAWAPAADRGSAAAASPQGLTAGRIQTTTGILAEGETYFLSIADVQAPFRLTLDFADTGGGARPDARHAILFVNGVEESRSIRTSETDGQTAVRHEFEYTGSGTVTVQLGQTNIIRFYRIVLEAVGLPPEPEQDPGTAGITLNWGEFADAADGITDDVPVEGGSVSILGNVTLSNVPTNATVRWLRGADVVGTGLTLSVSAAAQGNLGTLFVTAEVTVNGVQYSRLIRLNVTP